MWSRFECGRAVQWWIAIVLSLVLGTALTAATAFAQSSGNRAIGVGVERTVELLMFEEPGCPFCRRWHAEIGPAYPNTAEGKRAPLRILSMERPTPQGIALAGPIRFSPTFVLIQNGREVGRITGYPGPDFFWPLLEALMGKLSQSPASARRNAVIVASGIAEGVS